MAELENQDPTPLLHFGYESEVITDQSLMNQVWEMRKSGLGLLLSKKSYSRAIAFIEDITLPPLN